MSSTTATRIVSEYFAAWSSKNVEGARAYVAEDVQIVAPNGSFSGHAGFHEFLDGFVQMLTGVSGFTVYGDESVALAWYTTHLQPVPNLVAAERLTVQDEKITRIEITFDQMPLAEAFGGSAPTH